MKAMRKMFRRSKSNSSQLGVVDATSEFEFFCPPPCWSPPTHWSVGFLPSEYVKEKEMLRLQNYEWYVGDMSREKAESVLKAENKDGCFVVRHSLTTKGMYALSQFTKFHHSPFKHYYIMQNNRGEYYISEKHCFASIPDLISYHKAKTGGLCTPLTVSPSNRPAPPIDDDDEIYMRPYDAIMRSHGSNR